MRIFSIILLFCLFKNGITQTVNPNCDYFQNMEIGRNYYIYNPGYPNDYPANTGCRWVANSPPNSLITLSCTDFSIPPTTGCSSDRVAVSLNGNPNFVGASNYCGYTPLTLTSTTNAMSIGLFSSSNSYGGRLYCTINATAATTGCDCGKRKQTRIVGGQETQVNEFPYMAGLIDLVAGGVYCGAVIISNRYALTAYHCMINKPLSEMGLLVGDHNVAMSGETSVAPVLHRLSKWIPHPYYNTETEQNDIGIVQTTNQIVFGPTVGPICLPFAYSTYDFFDQTVTILGWGTTSFTGAKSDALQKVDVRVVDNSRCPRANPIAYSQVCAYASGKDSCQFDSGGPLVWHDWVSNSDMAIGIVSYGMACAGPDPSVNTRITSFLNWIQYSTPEVQYCVK